MDDIAQTLKERRSEIVEQIAQLRRDLSAIDKAITVFDPAWDRELVAATLPIPKRGLTRSVIDVLRAAPRPLSAREIGEQLLVSQGLMTGDSSNSELFARIRHVLRDKRRQKLVQSHERGQFLLWELAQ